MPGIEHTSARRASVSRAAVAAILAAALVLVMAPRAHARRIVESGWHLRSANGTVTLQESGSDPDDGLTQFTAQVQSHRRTTTNFDSGMNFTWPEQKITSTFPDPAAFSTIEHVSATIAGSASGTIKLSDGTEAPFSCNEVPPRPPATYFTDQAVRITGGALSSTSLGIGAVHLDPYSAFEDCFGPEHESITVILSPERIASEKPTYAPVPIARVEHGRRGEKMTLPLEVKLPIIDGDGTQVGQVVSKSFLHLVFNFSA